VTPIARRTPPLPFRRRSVVLLAALAVVVSGCLPDTVGPSRTPAGSAPGSPPAEPSPSGPTPFPSFVRPTPTPMPTFFSYTVVRGDSLVSIARRFATTGRSIAYWNRATYPSLDPESVSYAPNRIEVGWVLVLIPGLVVDEQNPPGPSPTPAAVVDGLRATGYEPVTPSEMLLP
jgi:hypothetical protein